MAVGICLVFVVSFTLVSGNACSGDGKVEDTCPEGQYCDGGECHNCSLCSVVALGTGYVLNKCHCVLDSYKICAPVPGSEEELIEDPSQLFLERFKGYEHLNESYDRKDLDCTRPTDGVTTEPLMSTPLSVLKTSRGTSTSGGTTKELATSPTKRKEEDGDNRDFQRGIGVGFAIGFVAACVIAIIVFYVIYKKYFAGKVYRPVPPQASNDPPGQTTSAV